MKRIVLALAISFFGTVNAQIKFGINGGFSSAVVSSKFDNLTQGYYAGVFSEIGIPGFATLQPALNYVKIDKDSYFQVPVMMKFYFVPKVNVQVGPQFAFRMNDSASSNKTNFGAAFGLGADLFSGLLIEARYAFQLNEAFKSPAGEKLPFNIFNVGLGIRF
ncbi:PorT family protein [Kaistella flava (ex Peng et al. 2021)]|uniref:PorT family protein n=1 Tax=Kaistella flava (ex Peng et al. 2021) TaxID=2038776 RepID=A0A7M2Y6Y1_9FLAO|nr:outer membrane beta-barrel protein [Kaistella flava (ex Peng et al. 2021)]QOW10007.1 PorT family protein [Kaistella flava (ex Peng et al. 2021)]